MSRTSQALAIVAMFLSSALAVEAMAASVRVSCEKRSTRAKISVDGRGLTAGDYTTEAISGGNIAGAGPVTAVRGQVETDYDSNPADIADGATPIAPNFIEGTRVTGKVIDASGFTVAEGTAVCRVKR